MMFRGGSLPQPVSDDSAVVLIVDQLGLGLKQNQEDKRVQMLNNLLQYLKARNPAYAAIAASASGVHHGALYQIAESVTEGVPANDDEIDNRVTAIANNTDLAFAGPNGWPEEIWNAAKLLWVKRLAAETAMKWLRAKLDAVDAQFPLEGEAEKSQRKINNKAREAAKDKISQAIKG